MSMDIKLFARFCEFKNLLFPKAVQRLRTLHNLMSAQRCNQKQATAASAAVAWLFLTFCINCRMLPHLPWY